MTTMIAYLPTMDAPATPSLLRRLLASLTARDAAPAAPAARKPSRRTVAELKRLADLYRDTQPSYADDLLAAAGLLKA
ncbi:hypothetical protein [Amphibiibacter pelophylacis]|uniref:Uncharacterized protein n=1 Tax=Amphibiibacter pelophylacis TaxID=1799477 RepID=A0ACC6P442_9BURK